MSDGAVTLYRSAPLPGFPGPTTMVEDSNGEFVRLNDYHRLGEELERQQAENSSLEERIGNILDDWSEAVAEIARLRAELDAAREAIRFAPNLMRPYYTDEAHRHDWFNLPAVRAACEGKR